MSNWSLRNDHEVSVVTLMMGLCCGTSAETTGERRNFRGIDSQREHHFSKRVSHEMIVISCSMNQEENLVSGVVRSRRKRHEEIGSTTMDDSVASFDFELI